MSIKSILVVTICFVIFVVILSFFVTAGQKPPVGTLSYSAEQKDRPKTEINTTFYDLGNIKVSDVKQKDFSFKNIGTKPLQILNINSSCGCTDGKIIYKDFTSKAYGMHSEREYVTEIMPGDTAILRLTYRPATMPVYGFVEREIYVTTNDPENQKLIFSIKANVK
ncbi:MAG: DUF1573 domain-containing protein [Patescibacteria group bacterium]|nr:DUF1573 domain-containing protein [Patescibacteria group bacterium]